VRSSGAETQVVYSHCDAEGSKRIGIQFNNPINF
jgi:hypothetical protein